MQLHQIFRASNNPVVMAGDSHNAWAYNLLDPNTSLPLAVEFDDASVTPPGLDELDQVIPGKTPNCCAFVVCGKSQNVACTKNSSSPHLTSPHLTSPHLTSPHLGTEALYQAPKQTLV